MTEKRKYIKRAFKDYVQNKKELSTIPIPGQSGLDYSKPAISSDGNENCVEKQIISYVDKKRRLEKQVEIVKRTLEHFRMEFLAKGKRHYLYICARWIKQMSYRRAAIECEISESTAGFWIEEIYTVAQTYAETYELF